MKKFNETEYDLFWSNIVKRIGTDEKLSGIDLHAIKDELKVCGGALDEESRIAYPGGLVEHIFGTMLYGEKIAGIVSKHFSDLTSLYRVCFLMHISKSEMFMKNPDEYQVSKMGRNYVFRETEGKLKAGLRSVVWCMNHGITLSPVEVEAMTVLDRDPSQGSSLSSRHDSMLATIVRQANELAYAVEKERISKK